MTLVLDTSILIDIEKKNQEVIAKMARLSETYTDPPAITFATFAEFYLGYLRRHPAKREQALKELDKYVLLNSTRGSTIKFAELKETMEHTGNAMSSFDLLIASVVIDRKMILVTRDKGFRGVERLNTIILD